MNDETAKKLAEHFRAANAELGQAIRVAKEDCSVDEFEIWRDRLAAIVGALVLDVLDPLYRERPALAPEALRDQYPIPPPV